jgi:protein-tyrosine phosphatase
MEKDGDMFPALRIGAEVLVNCALSDIEDLKNLCIDGTDTILLEFPFPSWSRWHVTEIHNIICKHGLTPVIAHAERYLTSPKQISLLDNFVYYGAKFQVNASAFLSFSGRRIIKAMIKEGLVSAIASDCHNETTRSPDITHALQRMIKTFDEELMTILYNESCALLAQQKTL